MAENDRSNFLQKLLFRSRWILLVFYFGLAVALTIYAVRSVMEVYHLVAHAFSLSQTEVMLVVLELVDIAMVANLLKMIIVGSYLAFVGPVPAAADERITSAGLKTKMSMSLVGICSIRLLRSFVNLDAAALTPQVERTIYLQCLIIGVFLVASIGMAFIDHIRHPAGHDASPKAQLHS